MILLNRLLSFIIPLFFLVVQLLYLKYSILVYSLTLIIFLLLIFYNLSLHHWDFTWRGLGLAGLGISQHTIFLLTATTFSLFVPNNWFYWLLSILLTIVFYLQLTHSFQTHYQFLLRGYQWLKHWQYSYLFLMIYALHVLLYNFSLYFNWSIYWLALASSLLIILLLIINNSLIQLTWLKLLFIFYVGCQVTLVLDFCPLDIYWKALLALLNYYFIFNLIIYKKFFHYYYES